MRIQHLPAETRPRERLLQEGPSVLSDAELVALVIGSGRRGASALEVAGEVLSQFGSLKEVARALPDDLIRIKAVGSAKAAGLAAAFELGRRAQMRSPQSPRMSGPADLARAVLSHVGNSGCEEVFVVAISAANRIRRVERVGVGSDEDCPLDVRRVLTAAMRLGSAGLAIVHTHPSGDTAPSPADIGFTRLLQKAADQLGLRLLDHLILSGTKWASLHELGYLESGQ